MQRALGPRGLDHLVEGELPDVGGSSRTDALSEEADRQKVVLPDWRGPVTVTMGNLFA